MPTPIDLGTAIMEAVREITGFLKIWVAGAEIRRMKEAIDTAERYIRMSALLIDDIKAQNVLNKDGKEKVEQLKKLEERFFKFN